MTAKVNSALVHLRAKEQLYDELVQQLADTERELAQLTASSSAGSVDPAWREIANDLAAALRPYTMFREQRVKDGRIVVETAVPGSTLTRAREALDRLGRQVAAESYRADGIPVLEDRTDELAA
jgi:hypothetical protein